jgi:hypothetical protein
MNVWPGILAFLILGAAPAAAAEWFVAPGGTGPGSRSAPFGRIQIALDRVRPGDTIIILPGTYTESLRTARNGTAGSPIRLRAEGGPGSVVVTAPGMVLRIDHAHYLVEGLVIDGQYGPADAVRVSTGGHYFVLRDSEVRRSSRDCVDMGGPHGVVIERSLIHHCLNAARGRTDAHGIVAGPVRGLTIRDTEIHTFSGDAIQLDPGRAAPGWDEVTIEGCRLWLQPLPGAANGFAAGTVPGENAVDTKTYADGSRGRMVIRDTKVWGFRGGLIANMSAFNLKEQVDVIVDGVSVHDSEIAFRLRGPARVAVRNAVVHDVATAFRYEEDIQDLRIHNVTIGLNVARSFQSADARNASLEVRNLLVLADHLPVEAAGPGNLAVAADAFVGAAGGDYRLSPGSPAENAGMTIEGVDRDRDGVRRPQGRAVDVGAYERCPAGCGERPEPPGGVRVVP